MTAAKETKKQREQREREEIAAAAAAERFAELNRDDYAQLSPKPRRRAREAALLLLYGVDFGQDDFAHAGELLADIGLSDDNAAFASLLAANTTARLAELDQRIAGYTRQWDVERISAVDRCVLRLALYELFYLPDTPANIVINEAIELAKKFGSDDSGAFVNGVLDAIYNKELKQSNGEV
ncbi:MAG: transcription antitermination factor NusB [Bacillota bacterium]|nr:transcription antitermination factor NusB [Bacillota bacterium]